MNAVIKVRTTKPMTSREMSSFILTVRSLCVKCQLLAQGRFDDFLEYTEVGSWRFESEFPILVDSDYPVSQDLPEGSELMLTLPESTDAKIMQAMQMLLHQEAQVELPHELRQLYRSDTAFRKQCKQEFWGYAERVREQKEPGG